MNKKTRIKLVGEDWRGYTKLPPMGEIFEVELLPSGDYFMYNGLRWGICPGFEIEILPDEPAPISEPEKPFEFRVGDKVKVPWSDKVYTLIACVGCLSSNYPLTLDGCMQNICSIFTLDGKLGKKHDKPVLTLVERPKKTVKKTYWVASYLDSSGDLIITNPDGNRNKLASEYTSYSVQFHEITREVLCE